VRALVPKLLLLVASVVLCLIVTETALRLAGFNPLGELLDGRQLILEPSPRADLRYAPRPGASGFAWGADVSINSLGFRDREVAVEKGDAYRILAIGDSITFANGLPVEARFTEQLERMLRREVDAPVEVLNLGIGGYDTLQEVAFLDEVGIPLSPDLVVLQFCVNDAGVVSANLRYIENMEALHSPIYRLRAAQLARVYLDRVRSLLSFHLANQTDAFVSAYRQRIVAVDDDAVLVDLVQRLRARKPEGALAWYASEPRLGRLRYGFRQLASLRDEHGFDVLVAIVPYLGADEGWDLAYAMVERLADEQGFEVVRLLAEPPGQPLEPLRMTASDFVHPNERGHRLIAETLFERIAPRLRADTE